MRDRTARYWDVACATSFASLESVPNLPVDLRSAPTHERAALTAVALPGDDPVVGHIEGSPGSLLDQLELGLGAGFLRALARPAGEIGELVLDYVDRDPRLDWNFDERDDYYALLLLHAGPDVAAVERLVIAHEPTADDPVDHSTLPLDVLVRLGVRGSRGAESALGRYLAGGVDLPGLLFVMQGDGERTSQIPEWRSAMERLGSRLCERFPSHEQLLCAMDEMREWPDPVSWSTTSESWWITSPRQGSCGPGRQRVFLGRTRSGCATVVASRAA